MGVQRCALSPARRESASLNCRPHLDFLLCYKTSCFSPLQRAQLAMCPSPDYSRKWSTLVRPDKWVFKNKNINNPFKFLAFRFLSHLTKQACHVRQTNDMGHIRSMNGISNLNFERSKIKDQPERWTESFERAGWATQQIFFKNINIFSLRSLLWLNWCRLTIPMLIPTSTALPLSLREYFKKICWIIFINRN